MPRPISSLIFTCLLLAGMALNNAHAQESNCPVTVTELQGTGNVAVGKTLAKGDTVKTDSDSFLQITLGDGALLKLGPRSVLYVDVAFCPDASKQSVRLKLVRGTLWAKGHASMPKFEVSNSHLLATVGTSTLAMSARWLDTMFTMDKESQKIATRDWEDTVNVLSHTFPFKGNVSRLFALQGNLIMIPWGSRGAMLRQDQQVTYGYKDFHISSKPDAIIPEELPFDAEGNYLGS